MRLTLLAVVLVLAGCSRETPPAIPVATAEPRKVPEPVNPDEPLALNDGRTFKEWKITSETSDSVYLRHSGGMSKVLKSALPEALQAEYPHDATLAQAEKEKDALAAEQKQLREARQRQQDAAARSAASRQATLNQANAREVRAADRTDINEMVRRAAKTRAHRFFEYEYQPMVTNRILSFDVAVDAEAPEPWAGVPGLYTVNGRGYVKFYHNSSGFERATKEFRVKVEVDGTNVKATSIDLR